MLLNYIKKPLWVRQTLPLPRTVPVEDEASRHKRLRWQRAQLGVQG